MAMRSTGLFIPYGHLAEKLKETSSSYANVTQSTTDKMDANIVDFFMFRRGLMIVFNFSSHFLTLTSQFVQFSFQPLDSENETITRLLSNKLEASIHVSQHNNDNG